MGKRWPFGSTGSSTTEAWQKHTSHGSAHASVGDTETPWVPPNPTSSCLLDPQATDQHGPLGTQGLTYRPLHSCRKTNSPHRFLRHHLSVPGTHGLTRLAS